MNTSKSESNVEAMRIAASLVDRLIEKGVITSVGDAGQALSNFRATLLGGTAISEEAELDATPLRQAVPMAAATPEADVAEMHDAPNAADADKIIPEDATTARQVTPQKASAPRAAEHARDAGERKDAAPAGVDPVLFQMLMDDGASAASGRGRKPLPATMKAREARAEAAARAIDPDRVKVIGNRLATAKELGQTPAVPIRESVTKDFLICLEDGAKMKMMAGYLHRRYGMTPSMYRQKWGLPPDYPMTAPNYSLEKRAYAERVGFGTTLRPAPNKTGGKRANADLERV